MSSITPLPPSYNSPIANALGTARQKRAAGAADASSDSSATTVAQAQAQSAAQDQEDAKVAALNAASFQQLEDKGITVKTVSFAGIYKDKLMSAVDTDGDKSISQSELYQQVQAGGGTQAQSDALYKAMDMDGDGTVSAKEFEDSIPNPYATPEFKNKLDNLMSQIQAGNADPHSLFQMYMQPDVDASGTLGGLAKQFPA